MTGRCRTAMARSPWPTARHWKPGWECTRSAAVRRRSPGCRPSSPWPTRSSSPASPANKWPPGNRRPRPPPHDFLLFVAVAYLDLLRAFQQQAIAQETLDHARATGRTDGRVRPQRTRQPGRRRSGANGAGRAQKRPGPGRRADPGCVGPAGGTAQFAVRSHAGAARSRRMVPIELVSHDAGAAELVADGLSHRPELAAEPPPRRRSGGATWIASATPRSCPTCCWT